MAKYNSEFLQIYLKDLYALYMAERNASRKAYNAYVSAESLKRNGCQLPLKPTMEDYVPSGSDGGILIIISWFFAAICVYIVPSSLFFAFYEKSFSPVLFAFMFSLFTFLLWSFGKKREKRYYDELNERKRVAKEKYQIQCDQYDKECVEIQENKNREIRKYNKQIRYWNTEKDRITKVINRVYDVNIIPFQYRDVYAIVYLFNYFRGSREDDLSLALNTFVSEQIKDRLDQIIENQEEEIMNQYSIIGNQYKSMQQRERHHNELCSKIDRMTMVGEERNTYIKMAESHLDTLEYFATFDQLGKIRF